MLTLYQAEWCPYCHRVRQVLTELELTYTNVNVPLARADRTQVRELSGQEAVPVLKDGRKVITGSDEIIAHLRATYPSPPDAADHAEVGRFRVVLELDEGPGEALELLREAHFKRGSHGGSERTNAIAQLSPSMRVRALRLTAKRSLKLRGPSLLAGQRLIGWERNDPHATSSRPASAQCSRSRVSAR